MALAAHQFRWGARNFTKSQTSDADSSSFQVKMLFPLMQWLKSSACPAPLLCLSRFFNMKTAIDSRFPAHLLVSNNQEILSPHFRALQRKPLLYSSRALFACCKHPIQDRNRTSSTPARDIAFRIQRHFGDSFSLWRLPRCMIQDLLE